MALSEVLYDSQTHDQAHRTAFDFDIAPGTRRYRLLNSNEPSDDAELNIIKSHMAAALLSLERLDDEVSRLRERIREKLPNRSGRIWPDDLHPPHEIRYC
ncbi:hypothetical protein C8R47DRAFT_1223324 [Mycena vitilis]|nr:hypothetical protein C8R47DRAFT_1223324 [Mycena vitilis]